MLRPLALLLLLTGCHSTHRGDPPILLPDAGRPDAAVADGGTTPDGGADASIHTCLPRELTPFAPGDRPMDFGVGGGALWLAHLHANPNPCDGDCSALLEVRREDTPQLSPVYWSHHYGPLTIATAERGAVAFSFDPHVDVPVLHWQRLPRRGEGWERDGELDLPVGSRFVGAAMGSDDTLYLALASGEDDGAPLSILEVHEEGRSVRERELPAPIGPRYQPRLVPRADAPSEPWLVSVQDWDVPPTVQIESLDGVASFHGSSCGVDDYDVAPLGGDTLAVVQRCGARLELQTRGVGESPPVILTERAAAVTPSVFAIGSRRLVIAYVEEGAASPTYEDRYLEGGQWRLGERAALPEDPELGLPIREVDVAAVPSALVIGVAWRGTAESEFFERPEGRIARIGPCI